MRARILTGFRTGYSESGSLFCPGTRTYMQLLHLFPVGDGTVRIPPSVRSPEPLSPAVTQGCWRSAKGPSALTLNCLRAPRTPSPLAPTAQKIPSPKWETGSNKRPRFSGDQIADLLAHRSGCGGLAGALRGFFQLRQQSDGDALGASEVSFGQFIELLLLDACEVVHEGATPVQTVGL